MIALHQLLSDQRTLNKVETILLSNKSANNSIKLQIKLVPAHEELKTWSRLSENTPAVQIPLQWTEPSFCIIYLAENKHDRDIRIKIMCVSIMFEEWFMFLFRKLLNILGEENYTRNWTKTWATCSIVLLLKIQCERWVVNRKTPHPTTHTRTLCMVLEVLSTLHALTRSLHSGRLAKGAALRQSAQILSRTHLY